MTSEPQESNRIELQPKEKNLAKLKAWRAALAAAAREREENFAQAQVAAAAFEREENLARVQAAVEAVQDFVGVTMPDGTVFAGMLPDGKKLCALPKDANVAMDFDTAPAYVQRVNREKKLGHDDWRIPTKEELDLLCENQNKGALKDTFNQDAKIEALTDGEYWSSTPAGTATRPAMYIKCFSDGSGGRNDIMCKGAVRLVR